MKAPRTIKFLSAMAFITEFNDYPKEYAEKSSGDFYESWL